MADFVIRQGDTLPKFEATLLDDGNAVDLTDAAAVYLVLRGQNTTEGVQRTAEIVSPATSGKVEYNWMEADTDTPGQYYAYWKIVYKDTSVATYPNNTNMVINIPVSLEIT